MRPFFMPPERWNMLRIGSLFSGAAGLDRAVQDMFGAEVAWHAEVDKAASKVLAHHYPEVPNLGDITKVDWENWRPMLEVDILCGGWPCQPFSLAGKRKGANDDRALWPYVARTIRVLRPRIVVLENVSAVLTAGEFERVANDLAACGYDFGWTCARASDVGAPHRRERLFVVATLPGTVRELLPTPNAADSSGGRYNSEGHQSTLPGTVRELLPTPRTSDQFGAGMHGDGGMDLRTTVTLLPTPTAVTSRNATSGRKPGAKFNSGTTLDDVAFIDQWGKYAAAIRRWETVNGPAPKPTEPNTKGKPRLNPEFSSWMMGWPAGWVTAPEIGISRSEQLKCIGNGVVPQCAAAAIRYLLAAASDTHTHTPLVSDVNPLLPTPCARDYKDGEFPASHARKTPSLGAIGFYLEGQE